MKPSSRHAAERQLVEEIEARSEAFENLQVSALLVDQEYPRGVKITDAEFASIALERHDTQPLRNYTICPRP